MKKNFIVCLLITTALMHANQCYTKHLAVINCPVADLVGEPLGASVLTQYKQLPLYADSNACPRIHQALYNELVSIVDETEHEYCLEILNTYFITPTNAKPQTRYWTLKKNCTLINNDIKTCIPTPISYKKQAIAAKKPVIVLTKPHHDTMIFSAGTRFVYLPEQSDNEIITAQRYDYTKKKTITFGLHNSACRQETTQSSPTQIRRELITMIRSWINVHHKTFIPYVWGGCSYVHRYSGNFKLHKNTSDCSLVYTYPKTKRAPHSGFDCAGLILRAAQIMGIPFFCKNSYTMAAALKPISDYSDIQVGDILWIPGHVMLIADLKRNTLIEARGYPQGYGKLQEISISEEFKDIDSIKQLCAHQNAHKPLLRLNKKGTVIGTIPQYKILKLY